jgi:hypothetical protein
MAASAAACGTGTGGVGACGTGGVGTCGTCAGLGGVSAGDSGAVIAAPGATGFSGGSSADPELVAKQLRAAKDKAKKLFSKTKARTKKAFRRKSA